MARKHLDEAVQIAPEMAEAWWALGELEVMNYILGGGHFDTQAASPIDDVRASAPYRRTIVDVFLHQCAQKVLSTLKNGGGN